MDMKNTKTSEKFTWTVYQQIKQERINKLKDKLLEIIQSEEQKEKKWTKLKELMYTIKKSNIHIEFQSDEKEPKNLFKEIMAKNFPDLGY